MKKNNALFIIIEGLDGAGTTTQTALLIQRFEALGQKAHATCEPSTGMIGTLARRYLSGELPSSPDLMALVFAADRIDHVHSEVEPKLNAGIHVISDRYVHSSLVYQGEDIDGKYSTAWVESLNSRARIPDLTFFIHVPVEVSLERIGERDSKDIYETEASLRMMEERYSQVMERFSTRGDRIHFIDGTHSISAIENEIFSHIENHQQ